MNIKFDGTSTDTIVIFAHGAGAGMDSGFMVQFANELATKNVGVVRFNFGYMQANAEDGKRRPPERMPKLLAHFESVIKKVISEYQPSRLFLMGKSMGGRVAAILAENTRFKLNGIICLGYPFVPIKGGNPRLEPLQKCHVPTCIIQGERDRFGNTEQVPLWSIPDRVQIKWINDGDHSLQPRKTSGFTWEQNFELSITEIINFIEGNT
ncbi:MAG: alpha/beta family hydrolase [Parashewanella sp.]